LARLKRHIVEAQLEKTVTDEKIDLVFDRNQGGVVHFNPVLDITARVLEKVNKEKTLGK
jgi:Skp family chaperone for outer membrane proteins